MGSSLPKVLQPLGGIPLLKRVVSAAYALNPSQVLVVHSEGQQASFKACLGDVGTGVVDWVTQARPLGTGDAVKAALPHLASASTHVLILCADMPLVSTATLTRLLEGLSRDPLHLVTGQLEDPSGLGRVVRDPAGNVQGIVEERDASPQLLTLHEVNAGIYCLAKNVLQAALATLKPNNSQQEYYLTDIVAYAAQNKLPITAFPPEHPWEIIGVNTFQQLARLERVYQTHLAGEWSKQGVHIVDPARFDARGAAQDIVIAADVYIDVNVVLEAPLTIESGVHIGPNVCLKNTILRKGAHILANSVIDGAEIGSGGRVGPFARIRPGALLSEGVHVGNFVEIKKTSVGRGSKINHLSYVGDAVIGSKVNVGAGTITCNYDGAQKHTTVIEDNVFIGSQVQLIAPVTVEKNATVGAGTTVTKNVKANTLVYNRLEHCVRVGWQRPEKAAVVNEE